MPAFEALRRPPATIAEPAAPPTPATVAVSRPFMPSASMLRPYLDRIDEARWYSNFGPLMGEFETRLAARFKGEAQVVGVANGTLGLALALRALGARPGGRCVMPAWTFVATAHAALEAGLEPWFADVEPETMALCPERVGRMLARAPREVSAVVVTAPFGAVPDPEPWLALQAATGVPVLVDGAAAFDAACDARLPLMVSLHATKALGVGEGGVIVTDDPALAARVRELSSFGFNGSRESRTPATNAKLSEYAAAVGLAALDAWPATRLRYLLAAQRLRMALARTPEVVFQPGWGLEWISSVCVVRLPEGSADRVETLLQAQGIDSRRWWSRGCHASPAFKRLPRGDLTVTDRLAARTLGVPYAADMDLDTIDRVAAGLAEAISQG